MNRRLLFLIKAILTLAFLGLLITWIGWGKIRDQLLHEQNLAVILPALALAVLFNLIKICKWQSMLRRTGAAIGFRQAAFSYLAGMAGGLFTPGRVGEVSRLACLPELKRSYVVAMTLLDRLLDVVVVVGLSLPGVLFFADYGLFWTMFAGCTAFLLILLLPFPIPVWMLSRVKQILKSQKLKALLETCERGIAAVPRRGIALWLSWSLLGYAVVLLEFYGLLSASPAATLPAVLICQPLIMLTNILPMTIAGIGVREGTAAFLLGRFAIDPAAAVGAAFQLFVLNTALPGLVGVVLLFFSARNKSPSARMQ